MKDTNSFNKEITDISKQFENLIIRMDEKLKNKKENKDVIK